jgi:erythromycin esterase-like protein
VLLLSSSYSFAPFLSRLIAFVRTIDPSQADILQKRYSTILSYRTRDPHMYGRDVNMRRIRSSEEDVLQALLLVLDLVPHWMKLGLITPRQAFVASQNARLVRASELYYRTDNHIESWNIRDTYMKECIESLIEHENATNTITQPKVIVW